MAIQPIQFIKSSSATATNGSDVITVTGNVDCSSVKGGVAVQVGDNQIVEGISGTVPNSSGVSTIKIRVPWLSPTVTARLVAFNAYEGLSEAIRRAREIVENISKIDDLNGSGVIQKNPDGSYELMDFNSEKLSLIESDIAELEANKDRIGISNRGTRNLNILNGTVFQTTTPPQALDDIPPADLGTSSNVYLHIKTPLNVNTDSEMFYFNINGYSFGNSEIINETISGYCYEVINSISGKALSGNLLPDCYHDDNGNVILRLLFTKLYVVTISVDTMRVGNGRLFERGDLEAALSLSDKINF